MKVNQNNAFILRCWDIAIVTSKSRPEVPADYAEIIRIVGTDQLKLDAMEVASKRAHGIEDLKALFSTIMESLSDRTSSASREPLRQSHPSVGGSPRTPR